MTQPKPTAGELAKELFEMLEDSIEVQDIPFQDESGYGLPPSMIDEIEKRLLSFSHQQAAPLVRALEKALVFVDAFRFKHGGSSLWNQADECDYARIKDTLAAHCANQKEDSK